jgi:hypothetical protein
MQSPAKSARIAIVGAGPGGLSTAYYLKQNGYTNVLVLEKLGRVGGLCHTITADGHSFDLGANYVTAAYAEILEIARSVDAQLYTERPFVAMEVPPDGKSPVVYSSIFKALRRDAKTGGQIPLLTFLSANLRYIWKRWRLRKIIDVPTMAGIENHPDLCEPFGDWLRKNELDCLITLFELPISMMGYGYIDVTPTLYALKFMTLKTYVGMAIKETPVIGPLWWWPKRFVDGYQRFWERVAWQLQVRLNVEVLSIDRRRDSVRIVFTRAEQEDNELDRVEDHLEFDYLVLACPLRATASFLAQTAEEQELFSKIRTMWYCMTTLHVKGLEIGDRISGAGPLAACYPLREMYEPWGVAKQWKDSDFVQFYTPIFPGPGHHGATVDHPREDENIRERVIRNIETTVSQMGGTIDEDTWRTYNRWPYFQHVDTDELKAGFYTRLENMQGTNRTFYVGGATNFELIEPIAEHSKALVGRFFPR